MAPPLPTAALLVKVERETLTDPLLHAIAPPEPSEVALLWSKVEWLTVRLPSRT